MVSIENLIGSAHDDQLFGDFAPNALSGGAGNDILGGEDGFDTLTGGSGDDRFYFISQPLLENADMVTDFSSSDIDQIVLIASVFDAILVAGGLSGADVQQSSSVSDGSGTGSTLLKFDTVLGALYYDADGDATGGAGLQLIAVLSGVSSLTLTGDASSDIFIVA